MDVASTVCLTAPLLFSVSFFVETLRFISVVSYIFACSARFLEKLPVENELGKMNGLKRLTNQTTLDFAETPLSLKVRHKDC